jgi:membrane-bound metal-dependent hydrolase YbcI (DUF457 family)
MKCPQCDKIPITFAAFLLIGWIHVKCRNCSSPLVLRSLGHRFWTVLASGIVVLGAMWSFLDIPYRWFGETATLVLFITIVMLTILLSMLFAWKDSRFDLR